MQTIALGLDMKPKDVSARVYAGSFVAEITLAASVERDKYSQAYMRARTCACAHLCMCAGMCG